MDVLEKIREEERAKLEALKEKEQEKTRIAIEKERTRLEAELAKEIKDLESQLNRAKNASQKVKARTSISSDVVEIPSIIVEENIDDNQNIEVFTSTNPNVIKPKVKEAKNNDTVKTVNEKIKDETPSKRVTSKNNSIKKLTPAQREKEKERARLAKEKEKEKARLAKEKEKEKEKVRLAKEKEKAKITKPKVIDKDLVKVAKSISEEKLIEVVDKVNDLQNHDFTEVKNESESSNLEEIEIAEVVKEYKDNSINESESISLVGNVADVVEYEKESLELVSETNENEEEKDALEVSNETNENEKEIEVLEIASETDEDEEVIESLEVARKTDEEEIEIESLEVASETDEEEIEIEALEVTSETDEVESEIEILEIASETDEDEVEDKIQPSETVSEPDDVVEESELFETSNYTEKIELDSKIVESIDQNEHESTIIQSLQEDIKESKVLETPLPIEKSVSDIEEKTETAIKLVEEVKREEKQVIVLKDDRKLEKSEDKKVTEEKNVIIEEKSIPKSNDVKSKPNTAMTSLQKLREKIAAQKRLEKELMEREALRVQEKERTLQDKFASLQKIIEEEENLVTLEELEQERINVDNLRREKEELESHLDVLQGIVDRIVDLRVDGIKVINNDTWELTEEFTNMGIDSKALNHTVLEIEEELDALSKSHEEYINKLIKAEENYKTLEDLYKEQEKLIEDLNKQLNNLREQVAKEKVINREYSSQIEKLKNEKSRLERSYKYFRQTDTPEDVSVEGVYGILGDLERLNEEVKRLINNDESKKVKAEVEKKDQEIENLKQQLESYKARQIKEQDNQYPYYINAANMFIPKGYQYGPYLPPQNNVFDIYLQEVEKLRLEIDSLKQVKMSEPVANPEVFKEQITEVKANPSAVVQPETEVTPKVEQLKLIPEEDPKDNENLQRIKELEKEIQEKDLYIENLKQKVKEYTEEDIFDPSFKRKIRVTRDKKTELLNRSNEEEQMYIENTKDIHNQINIIKTNIDGVKDRIFDLDMSYRQNRDYSSAAKDEYEKAKGKALVELQLQEEKLNNYNEDLAKVKQKYDRFLNNKEEELKKLNEEEINIIQHYLNKIIQDNKISSKIRSTEEEKQNLVDELDQLRADKNDVVTEIDAYAGEESKKQLTHRVNNLEVEIKEQTKQYNIYYEKITELKTELNKRLELEGNLKQNDDDVVEYTSTKQSLEDCENEYNQKNERIAVLQLEIQDKNPSDKESILRKKAEISDLIVHREDLKTKMDYFKAKLEELEVNSNVLTYKKLNNQINQIRKISKDHRLAAESLKADVQTKTNQLEKLKSELNKL